MNVQLLIDTANEMVAEGKGLLAIDESTGTCNKGFEQAGIPQTEEMRRSYRDLIVNTPGISESISGMILFDERFASKQKMGSPSLKLLPRRELSSESKWTWAQSLWPGSPEKRSPRV